MRFAPISIAAALVALSVASAIAGETKVQTRGKIDVGVSSPLVAVSTDPVVQRVLNDDFYAARRAAAGGANGSNAATLTITLAEHVLKPGVSLNEIAPGDPGVVSMLRAAGAQPPPVADTGSAEADPYETAARLEATRPDDPETQALREQQAFQQSLARGGPADAPESMQDQGYDRVLVARVTVNDRRDQFTVVAVAHPGDDMRDVKKLVAEEIANAALH